MQWCVYLLIIMRNLRSKLGYLYINQAPTVRACSVSGIPLSTAAAWLLNVAKDGMNFDAGLTYTRWGV